MLSLPRVQSLVRKIRSDNLLLYWGAGGRGEDLEAVEFFERVCRTGLVPLGASLLRDGPWEVDGEQRGGGKRTGGWSPHRSWEDAGSRQPL